MTTDRRIEYLPLDDIVGAERNPKRHFADGLTASIGRFGYASPALRDERTGRLVVGHGRTEALRAMRDAGDTPPSGVTVDDAGRWLVPVVCGWASRSDAEAEAYLVADNRHTELGGWDNQELAALLQDVQAFDPELLDVAGFDLADLEELLADGRTELPAASGDPDDAPEPPERPVSEPGDLWLLGPHRLLCGDATNPDHLDRVLERRLPGIVYTDPPYGISIVKGTNNLGGYAPGTSTLVPPGLGEAETKGKVGGGGPFGGVKNAGRGKVIQSTEYLPVAGDETTQTATDAFQLIFGSYPEAAHIWWGGNHYAASAGLPDSSCWLVWDKDNTGNFADCELAWTNHPGAVRLLRHMWNGMLRASERGKRVHPTQKPVALAVWAFEQVDPKADRRVVLDVFGGSGSTLIAAHQTGRAAAICEMEPHYVDVIARRYQEATGDKPVLAATGEPHDFCAEADQ